ncbi:MAG: hypothetical protein BZY81_07660 [SAR202 cluster bacterium Io17-Chloro-G4]|nr:MAG: hypothetical protein BZY81_07660 [SAR202 cluster bacterium Io17-Chloro-G4]
MRVLLAMFLILGLVGCGSGGFFDRIDGEVAIKDEMVDLEDGKNLVYRFEKGTYEFQLTASASVAVNWVGSDCRESPRTQSYTDTCEFSGFGQLIITNSTGLTSGVSIKITQLVGD